MKIKKNEVIHIAELSRLKLSDEEVSRFQIQLSGILEYIEKLNEIDVLDIKPTSHVLQLDNVFRDDELKKSMTAEDALSNAPDRSGNFYRVPRIID
ncbi:glutamyl-tRNA(Gln) amidotransferase subunit C [bacterium BMS3Abin07]|nr:glutamyl-tRNA(Gln) amidotransferase subunit C [bacterium BMS3Abin07]GBE33420.1 glutamyl-tRNA(Gln) amidotransferase subunit C [bacterium BMS3Bbin05]HDL21058.1 Asp-tRNA(Asn)/Glu-tRNA(Gln) amidotransferase subunit GatC [Nitrospirota bacterium]HDO21246.1 Asp-tRNA(Asn)/Glu-tRNA(Gln) amidotransferase subunit GatC [Nitrospirota bacterium]